MSKMFILDRSGVNPSMVETPKNSIPVYADKESAEADLTNLSVGQIVATESTHEDDVADLKTYIKNQNILSDDNDFSVIQGATSATNMVEMPYDGFISAYTSNDTGRQYFFVSADGNTQYGYYSLNNNASTSVSACMQFKKGWHFYTLGFSGASTTWNDTYNKVHFYKFRDYTGR